MSKPPFARGSWVVWLFVSVLFVSAAPTAPAQQKKADAATKQLMAANGLFRRGLFELAAQDYSGFLTKYPGHAESGTARYGLAICHYRLNQYAKAAEHLQELVKDRQFKQRDEALAVLGHCLLSRKAYDKALAAFDELLDQHPKSKHAEIAALNRAQVLYLLGKSEASLSACQEFLKNYPSSARRGGAEYFLACSQAALGKHGEAAETLRKFLAEHKDSPHKLDATLLLGQCFENQKKFDAAVEQYRSFIEIATPERRGEGHYSLGLMLYKAAKYAESIKELSVVVSKHGKNRYAGAARLQLGLAQLAAGKPAKARKTLTMVAQADKQRAQRASYWLAQCDMAEGKFQLARAKLEALAKASPKPENLEAILYDRGICDMELGKFEDAAEGFATFCRQYPKSKQAADALYRQAFCLHKLGRYADSQSLCRQVAKQGISRITGPAAELAAENLFLMGKHAEAAKRFGELIKAPRPARDEERMLRFRFRLGQCAFLSGNYPKAIKLLKQVAAHRQATQNKHLREATFFLGDAQFQVGQYDKAAKTLAKYLAGEPQRRQEAHFKLGLSQLRAGQTAEAEKTLASMMAGAADSPWVMRATFAYGQMAYHKLRQPAKAAQALQKVLAAQAPEELVAPSMYLLASIDFDAKEYSRAADRFADLVKRFGKHELAPDAALQQAICAKEMGKTKQAIRLLKDFAKAYPKAKRIHEAQHLMGTCLAKLSKHAEAVEVFSALADDKSTRTEAVLYELAWSQRANKATKEAAKTYQKLLSEFPTGKLAAPARTELAELLYLDKKYAEAASLLERVVSDTKANAKMLTVARYRLGWCYAELSQPAKSAAVFTSFAQKYPTHKLASSAMYQAGVAHMLAENHADAQKCFSALLAKYPEHDVAPLAYLKLGEVQANAGEYDKSAVAYQTFLKKYPKSKFAYLARFGMGWALENQKQYGDARKWYLQVTAGHNGPTAARAQFQIGECYFAERNFERAAKELLSVDIVYGYPEWSARALYEAGRAFEQLGQIDRAKSQYVLCIKKYKDSDSAGLAEKRMKALRNPKK